MQLHYVYDGELAGGPERITAEVALNGESLVREIYEPAYRVEELNGPGCGVATIASARIIVLSPWPAP